MKLIATKSFNYNTRRLQPGDLFEAKDPDGRLLIGVRKARKIEDRKEKEIPKPNADLIISIATGGFVSSGRTFLFGETPTDYLVPTKTEEPKTEEPKTEEPKTEEPKTEEPKISVSKPVVKSRRKRVGK